ncbi:MAG: 16S rRNA (cytidine(1402)-2'-O)-methyltransferase [Magnetovibrio sp.]|nr:16S rRNA (cytidine(1402)-2'-O)-methyltransferase [Magnetovibrio sp.]
MSKSGSSGPGSGFPHAGADTNGPGGESKPSAAGGLVVVATPIGNAADLGARALDVLAGADVIACEDTRVTAKLLAIHGIKTPTLSYHEHNAAQRAPAIIKRLKGGETVALVSDAGTPLVSDPGYRLVGQCIEAGVALTAVPGPSSVMAALVLSGLPTDRFFFQGFLAAKAGPRRRQLAELAAVPATLVVMESAKRLAAMLTDAADALGPRAAAVTRELTKKFEEVRRGALPELARHYRDAGPPKGEVTVVIGPPLAAEAPDAAAVDALLRTALSENSVRDAAQLVAEATGLARRDLYQRALALQADRDE